MRPRTARVASCSKDDAKKRTPPTTGHWIRRLLRWYRANKRDLPWRRNPTPYRVWISEVMLQQTRVDTVLPYYARFLRRFPTLHKLASAPEQEVLTLWAGLGYYHRARSLHATARLVARGRRGRFPNAPAELGVLPGIGSYTAAAIASICFGKPVPVFDGNVDRVFSRFLGLRDRDQNARRKKILPFLNTAIAHSPPSEFNQAAMELGALICNPAAPRCDRCPLRNDCVALAQDRALDIPPPRRRTVGAVRECVVVVIRSGGTVALQPPTTRRRMLHGLWTLPGMLIPARRSRRAAHELCTRTVAYPPPDTKFVATLRHAYSHFILRIHVYTAVTVVPVPRLHVPFQWKRIPDIDTIPMDSATRKAILSAIASIGPEVRHTPPSAKSS